MRMREQIMAATASLHRFEFPDNCRCHVSIYQISPFPNHHFPSSASHHSILYQRNPVPHGTSLSHCTPISQRRINLPCFQVLQREFATFHRGLDDPADSYLPRWRWKSHLTHSLSYFGFSFPAIYVPVSNVDGSQPVYFLRFRFCLGVTKYTYISIYYCKPVYVS